MKPVELVPRELPVDVYDYEGFQQCGWYRPPEKMITYDMDDVQLIGLVVICTRFKNFPDIEDEVKADVLHLFHAMDQFTLANFKRQLTRCLINPSVVEFLDVLEKLQAAATPKQVFFCTIVVSWSLLVLGYE